MTAVVDATGGTPLPLTFRAAALGVPSLIALQFFLVGLAVFSDGGAWDLHKANGAVIAVPVIAAFAMAFASGRLSGFRAATSRLLVLYVMQFVWLELGEATGSGVVQAVHALNAVFLMGASAALAERTARPPTAGPQADGGASLDGGDGNLRVWSP